MGLRLAILVVALGVVIGEVSGQEVDRPALRAVADDETAELGPRAAAIATLAEDTPPERRSALQAVFREVARSARNHRSIKAMDLPMAVAVAVRRQPPLVPEDAYYLAARALNDRDPVALSLLGHVPGTAARTVILAVVPGPREYWLRESRQAALRKRVELWTEDVFALRDRAAARPALDPERIVLLLALLPAPRPGAVESMVETLTALGKVNERPRGATRDLLRELWLHPRPEYGPPLAALVTRRPELLDTLEEALFGCGAEVDKEVLWGMVLTGGYRTAGPAVDLLQGRLDDSDRDHLLDMLAPRRYGERGFHQRLQLLLRGDERFLTPEIHEALWGVAESGPESGLRGALNQAVLTIARYREPRDDPRLERLAATGEGDVRAYAFRELLRRAGEPMGLLASWLTHEEPARRKLAESVIRIDFFSRPRLPVPRTRENWVRMGDLLMDRLLVEPDPEWRRDLVTTLFCVTVDSPLSPLAKVEEGDMDRLAAFYGKLLETETDPQVKTAVASRLQWVRSPAARLLLERLAEDPDLE